jgi:hypothetical protein
MSSETPDKGEEKEETNPEKKELDYELLSEEYSQYDLSFKIIVIGNSGNANIIIFFQSYQNYRRWEIMFINSSNET